MIGNLSLSSSLDQSGPKTIMDQGTKTRFQRKGVAKIPEVRGTKKSLTNFQLLVGTGVPDLDHILGGGLPVGSLVLIEDLPCKSRNDELFESTEGFSNVLVKYFLGEGRQCFQN